MIPFEFAASVFHSVRHSPEYYKELKNNFSFVAS